MRRWPVERDTAVLARYGWGAGYATTWSSGEASKKLGVGY